MTAIPLSPRHIDLRRHDGDQLEVQLDVLDDLHVAVTFVGALQNVYAATITIDPDTCVIEAQGAEAVALLLALHALLDVPIPGRPADVSGPLLASEVALCCPAEIEITVTPEWNFERHIELEDLGDGRTRVTVTHRQQGGTHEVDVSADDREEIFWVTVGAPNEDGGANILGDPDEVHRFRELCWLPPPDAA